MYTTAAASDSKSNSNLHLNHNSSIKKVKPPHKGNDEELARDIDTLRHKDKFGLQAVQEKKSQRIRLKTFGYESTTRAKETSETSLNERRSSFFPSSFLFSIPGKGSKKKKRYRNEIKEEAKESGGENEEESMSDITSPASLLKLTPTERKNETDKNWQNTICKYNDKNNNEIQHDSNLKPDNNNNNSNNNKNNIKHRRISNSSSTLMENKDTLQEKQEYILGDVQVGQQHLDFIESKDDLLDESCTIEQDFPRPLSLRTLTSNFSSITLGSDTFENENTALDDGQFDTYTTEERNTENRRQTTLKSKNRAKSKKWGKQYFQFETIKRLLFKSCSTTKEENKKRKRMDVNEENDYLEKMTEKVHIPSNPQKNVDEKVSSSQQREKQQQQHKKEEKENNSNSRRNIEEIRSPKTTNFDKFIAVPKEIKTSKLSEKTFNDVTTNEQNFKKHTDEDNVRINNNYEKYGEDKDDDDDDDDTNKEDEGEDSDGEAYCIPIAPPSLTRETAFYGYHPPSYNNVQ